MTSEQDKEKCAHPSCTCTAAAGEKYCSPHCEAALETEIVCGCGHRGCLTTAGAASTV